MRGTIKKIGKMIEIFQVETPEQVEEARRLFREYETWLDLDLCFQGFATELANLPGRYQLPHGRLLLATSGGETVGCIALRKINDRICEMKRLFVRDAFRGKGIGLALLTRLIVEAREIGYERMRLDTFPPKMQKAVELYERFAFRQIEPYHDNPHTETLFMELELKFNSG